MKAKPISRREFLKGTGVALGAAAVACSGVSCSAPQAKQETKEIATPDFHYGKDEAMDRRILITYATRTGSTVEVAAAIGETISQQGYSVDVKPVKDNPSLEGYTAVVMGSAVNGAQWLPEAVEFAKNNQAALGKVPVALFCVHILNLDADEGCRKNRLAYLNAVRKAVRAVDEAWFAGVGMETGEAKGLMRFLYKTLMKGGEGDCRDWDAIRAWAEGLPAKLS